MVLRMKFISGPYRQLVLLALGITLLGGTFYAGLTVGRRENPAIIAAQITSVINKEDGKPSEVDFGPFWKAWATLQEKYVDSTTTPNDQKKVWGAIEGLASAYGDPYTVFFPPVESKAFGEAVSGGFEGVGMEVGIKDEVLTVIAPLKDTPAYRGGIKAGDKIVKIDGKSTQGLTVEKAVDKIRGKGGTSVTLTVLHEGAKVTTDITLVREKITIPTTKTELRKDGVFVISLYNFSEISFGLFRDALREFIQSGSDKLVIDLRNNPGGYLEAAVDMASWFLPPGEVIVREHYGDKKEETVHRSKGYNIFTDKLKLVILMNQGSASASEILAGALHDHGKATLVGERSFGKGSVQELVPITSETSLKVTIAKWLTPKGTSISNGGLTPDVVATSSPEDFAKGIDTQLEKAAEVLKNK